MNDLPLSDPGIPRERVVAVVVALRDGREQVGSGYLIGGRLVLTAEHCTRDKLTGEPALGLRVIRATDALSTDQLEPMACPALDVACLKLTQAQVGA